MFIRKLTRGLFSFMSFPFQKDEFSERHPQFILAATMLKIIVLCVDLIIVTTTVILAVNLWVFLFG